MKNKKNKIIIFILVGVVTALLLTTLFFLIKPRFILKNFNNNIQVEYKEKYTPSIQACYGNIFSCKKLKAKIKGSVDTYKLGKYSIKYQYQYDNKKYEVKQNVNVCDSTKPKIKTDVKEVYVCKNGKIQDFTISAIDNYDGDITNNIKKEYNKEKNVVIIKVSDSNKNESIKEIKATIKDDKAPEIIINGLQNITLTIGTNYEDEGVIVKDNCDDDIKYEVSSNVDYNKEGNYKITYTAKDSSDNTYSIDRNVIIKNGNYKVVYLTFDDGPSEYTSQLLDILKKYNVKATFFVTGHGPDDMILREYNEGHKIALHTNTHNYSYVYTSVDNYFEDLYAVQNRVERITGYKSNLIRFPGGSSNTVSANYDGGTSIMSRLVNEVENRGFHYFDWNVSSGDGGGTQSTDQVFINVTSNLKEESSIVLQHDTQKFSIDAVERIIKYCNENGYTFKVLDENSPGAHHGVNN